MLFGNGILLRVQDKTFCTPYSWKAACCQVTCFSFFIFCFLQTTFGHVII